MFSSSFFAQSRSITSKNPNVFPIILVIFVLTFSLHPHVLVLPLLRRAPSIEHPSVPHIQLHIQYPGFSVSLLNTVKLENTFPIISWSGIVRALFLSFRRQPHDFVPLISKCVATITSFPQSQTHLYCLYLFLV